MVNARPDISQAGYPLEKQPDGYQGVTPDHSAEGVSAQQYTAGSSAGFGASAGSAGFGVSGGGASFGAGHTASSSNFGVSGSDGSVAQNNVISGFQSQQDYTSSLANSASSSSFPGALQQSAGAASFGSSQNGFSSAAGSSAGSVVNSRFGSGSSSSSASQGSSRYQGAAAAAYADAQQLEPIITKNFYFEAAPEEPEESQAPRFIPIGRPQKNYKIIFIKTPAFGLNSQVIPIVPPNEEKTIVYVLSKRPEFNQDVELPAAPVTEATKPEVFFIKYKNEAEAQDAQSQIQGNHARPKIGTSVLYNKIFSSPQHFRSISNQRQY